MTNFAKLRRFQQVRMLGMISTDFEAFFFFFFEVFVWLQLSFSH